MEFVHRQFSRYLPGSINSNWFGCLREIQYIEVGVPSEEDMHPTTAISPKKDCSIDKEELRKGLPVKVPIPHVNIHGTKPFVKGTTSERFRHSAEQ